MAIIHATQQQDTLLAHMSTKLNWKTFHYA